MKANCFSLRQFETEIVRALGETMEELRRILVVEDEDALREILTSLIREAHIEVDEAPNGAAALQKLKTGNFSLVVSDIQMPKMNGFEFFVQAKAAGSQVPFVFITAFGDQENILKALRLGAFDFIKKPFDDQEVLSVVNRALEVGFRRAQILKNLKRPVLTGMEQNEKHEKMIRLLELENYKKRA